MNKFERQFDVDLPGYGEAMEATRKKEEAEAVETAHKNMEGFIGRLEAASKFERTPAEDGAESLKSREGEQFVTKRIENHNDPMVREVWQMMKAEFGDEADPLYWVKESIRQGINKYDVITGPDGKIISFSNSRYLEMEPVAGRPPESLVYMAFILTDEEHRRKGLATELNRKLSLGALEQARQEGHAVRGMVGESTETSEKFWNKIGKRRVYFEDSEGNIHEVPYKAPPCDYDDNTGEPLLEGAFEHLMVNMFDGSGELKSGDLVRMARTIYFEEYGAEPEDYASKKAWQRTQEVLVGYLKEFEQSLAGAKDGRVFLMSEDERNQKQAELKAKGKEVVEVKIAEE
ncbi:MAG: hypothetical protein HYV66_02530 [Candidatus Sungbacteria bacterium]|uniref:N-acetyltransferase domain-containing protein n=1 Tax=Candidatus Sungiibacteriota bacterium TaxID=2750080 RepID=A0A931YDT4_9BACT|nr:hypothetical protein [Candidatus Sungbacteria bacterium]